MAGGAWVRGLSVSNFALDGSYRSLTLWQGSKNDVFEMDQKIKHESTFWSGSKNWCEFKGLAI